jgi:MFS family permease
VSYFAEEFIATSQTTAYSGGVLATSSSAAHANRQLRQSIQRAYANAALWGLGSGLASMTLVIYFAREFQARGQAIAWLLATPAMVGLLRLWTPRWLDRVGSRRRFCVAMFLASSAALAALPVLAAPDVLSTPRQSIFALGAAWTAYQVLEFIGVVALWSWLGDLVPARIRGRFVGRREAWTTAGAVVGSVLAAATTYYWGRYSAALDQPGIIWKGYAACASFGAALLALATTPLTRMHEPAARTRAAGDAAPALRDLLTPWTDASFRRLMYFGLWFSMANGLAQSPRSIYIASVLKLDFAAKRILDGLSRGIQILALPPTGAAVDRRGNRPVLIASWSIVAAGSLFFLIATPARPWLIGGAYACWIAYAGLNVTLPNLMLGLSRPGQTAVYASAWFAWTNLAYAMSILAGGWLFDWLASHWTPRRILGGAVDHFTLLFAFSSVLLAMGVAAAARVPEPGRELPE